MRMIRKIPTAGLLAAVLFIGSGLYAQDADTLAIPGAVLTRDIKYGNSDPKQNFDLYKPDAATLASVAGTGPSAKVPAGIPLVIWIHGGGWWTGGKKNMEVPYLIGHGYAIASVAYRFSQDSVFPAQIRDCNAAIRYIFQHAGDLGIDTSRVVVAGASAGGHLASLVGMSLNNKRQEFDPYPLEGRKISIKGVLNFYGPADLHAFHGDGTGYKVDSTSSSVSRMLGASPLVRPDLAKWASPATYIDRDDPPVLILHGDKDPIIHYYLAPLFYNTLRLAGVKATLVTVPGGGHGGREFSDTERQAQVLEFLRQVIPPPALLVVPGEANAQGKNSLPLDGAWTFALDPVSSGETEGWYRADYPSGKFDPVAVPHCFSVDKRYELYTGKAWYFRRWGAVASPEGTHQFLHFDAVFYKSRVWLNGEWVGQHEGGYTPFELEVTGKLRDQNVLAVEVDNSWDTTTIPGAKTSVPYQSANMSQLYPWINYGGITRPVKLLTRPGLYVRNIKIVTDPDLKKGSARVQAFALVRNLGATPVRSAARLRIFREGKEWNRIMAGNADIAAGADGLVRFETVLSPAEVQRWDQDHPNLYDAEVSVGEDTMHVAFGIRKLEIQGNRLLLNGEPIRMGGANRPLDHPEFGSMDPASVLEKDLALMKGGCMELSRINHYAVSTDLLNWADRNGLLIIEEAGNWQMTPKQMRDTGMRRKWQAQMREMVERDWNHPCIFAWSVGNEFQSQTQEGIDWVKDMRTFTRRFDSSRPITFATMMLGRDEIRTGQDEASQYVDFVSANIYGNHRKVLQHIHALYPDKPVFVSEFGIRSDQVKEESDRVKHLQDAMAAFRQCDFLIGACIWTFQDYRSRFPGTNSNGYRPWGLVGPQREIREMYTAWQEEFAPAILQRVVASVAADKPTGMTIRVTARNDFPSYILRNYTVRCNGQTVPLRTLAPGESQEISFDKGDGEVELIKPGGFVILRKVLP